MTIGLLGERRFAPLFWCQFCSALSDNFMKNALAILILFGIGSVRPIENAGTAALLVTLSSVTLIAPFFFLSALGGELADKYDKARVARVIKLAEIPVAVLAAVGFVLHSVPILFAALLGFGVLAALFGPLKYGILPEKLATSELAQGNALVEAATFLAILLGTIGGGLAVAYTGGATLVIGVVLALAIACWVMALAIPEHGAAAPRIAITANPLASTFALLRELKRERRLRAGAHVTSWFWMVGVLVMSLLPVLVKDVIGGGESVYTLALTAFVIGIATGSALAAGASHGRPNLAVVPIGAIGMAVAALALAALAYAGTPAARPAGILDVLGSFEGVALLLALVALSISGGLYVVPAFAVVQSWAPPDARARVVASVNVLNAAYMTGGGALLAALQAAGTPVWMLLAAIGIATLAVHSVLVRPWVEGATAPAPEAISP